MNANWAPLAGLPAIFMNKIRGVKRLEKLNFIRNYLQWTDLSTHTPRQGRNDKNVGKQNATPHPSELFLNFKIRKEAKKKH